MSENHLEKNESEQKSENLAWEQLWEVTKQWAVMSQFEADQDWYKKMKEYYE
jgi:muconolactone delta-isomerase